jgi:HD-GYP domain-containing protein (c-di-GMP phosphodiesterase class II)
MSAKVLSEEHFQDLKEFLFSVMKSFVKAIEEKDRYTRGHSDRVNKFSLQIGSRLGLSSREMESLNIASLLHDIGKIGVSKKILNKTTELTKKEYASIQQHVSKGYEILIPIKQLENCLPIILYHHERIDGKGYPKGLRDKEIPLLAKVIAVADVYDAITSDRAYRDARSSDEAIQEMRRVSGTQLDTDITTIFIEQCLEVNSTKNNENDRSLADQIMEEAGP